MTTRRRLVTMTTTVGRSPAEVAAEVTANVTRYEAAKPPPPAPGPR